MSRKYKILDQEGMYFLTMTVVDWIDVFTREKYKKIITESLTYCQKEKGLIVFAYVIMSNHIHLIAMAKQGYNLTAIIRDFKVFTAKKIMRELHSSSESRKDWILLLLKAHAQNKNLKKQTSQFWQQGNHPIELYSNPVINQKLEYIHLNPVRAGWVELPEHYLYSSAKNYIKGIAFASQKLDITLLDYSEMK